MKSINLLDSETINKIAAGEVVERPSSVVKELVENAIDAGAGAITVEIRDGGISMIRVTDNGSGIDPDDIDTAFARHATSKIQTAEDLLTIASLGFRGEALSSIAAVSQVELITKTREALVGIRYLTDGGQMRLKEEIGCPDGTTILIRNLFYNTPARRKFLKTAATEAGYCGDLLNRLALSHPEISFQYIQNGQVRLHTSGNGNLKDIIYNVFGRDVTGHLLPVELTTKDLHITGFIGKPILSRGNRSWENYFINHRYIKSAIVTKAIEDAYKTFVMIHKFPFTALHIDIDTEMIDVNVHPRKMELRFNQNEAIYEQIYRALRSVLEQRELVPSVSLSAGKKEEKKPEKGPEPFELQRLASYGQNNKRDPGHQINKTPSYDRGSRQEQKLQEKSARSEPAPLPKQASVPQMPESAAPAPKKTESVPLTQQTDPAPMPKKTEPAPLPIRGEQMQLFDNDQSRRREEEHQIRLIGQIYDTYWMFEYDGKLMMMDQHAAHEKVLYERFRKEIEENKVASQMLAPPVIMTLTPQEISIFERYSDYLKELGFETEPFGGNEYALYAVPLQLFGMTPGSLFVEILDYLTEESRSLEGSAITYKIATMACKAAVKGGERISDAEAVSLIQELLRTDHPYTCPHGRPTMIHFTRYELDKLFKRIQN